MLLCSATKLWIFFCVRGRCLQVLLNRFVSFTFLCRGRVNLDLKRREIPRSLGGLKFMVSAVGLFPRQKLEVHVVVMGSRKHNFGG